MKNYLNQNEKKVAVRNSLEKLNQFKVGDKVAIHNVITNEVSYIATITAIADYAFIKYGSPSRFAVLIDDNGNTRENLLGSAKKI